MEHDDVMGTAIFDSEGEHIGKVEQTYPNAGEDVRYVRVKIGTLLAKHRLVPLDGAEPLKDGLRLPYTKQAIVDAPELPDDADPLSGMLAEDLRGYYAGTRNSDAGASTPASDPIAPALTESTAASDRVGDEERVVTNDDIPEVSSDAGEENVRQVRDHGDVVEIPIVEERLVKQPVVTEVVRVRKNPTTTEQNVSADVRKEDIETDTDVPVKESSGES